MQYLITQTLANAISSRFSQFFTSLQTLASSSSIFYINLIFIVIIIIFIKQHHVQQQNTTFFRHHSNYISYLVCYGIYPVSYQSINLISSLPSDTIFFLDHRLELILFVFFPVFKVACSTVICNIMEDTINSHFISC